MGKLIVNTLVAGFLIGVTGMAHAETRNGLFLVELGGQEVILNGTIETFQTPNGYAKRVSGVGIGAMNKRVETMGTFTQFHDIFDPIAGKYNCDENSALSSKELENSPTQMSLSEENPLTAFQMKVEQVSNPAVYSVSIAGTKTCYTFVDDALLAE